MLIYILICIVILILIIYMYIHSHTEPNVISNYIEHMGMPSLSIFNKNQYPTCPYDYRFINSQVGSNNITWNMCTQIPAFILNSASGLTDAQIDAMIQNSDSGKLLSADDTHTKSSYYISGVCDNSGVNDSIVIDTLDVGNVCLLKSSIEYSNYVLRSISGFLSPEQEKIILDFVKSEQQEYINNYYGRYLLPELNKLKKIYSEELLLKENAQLNKNSKLLQIPWISRWVTYLGF